MPFGTFINNIFHSSSGSVDNSNQSSKNPPKINGVGSNTGSLNISSSQRDSNRGGSKNNGNILRRRSTMGKLLKAKTIGFFGGVCLLVNGMMGPGIPFTPSLFQESGWVFPIILFGLFTVISCLSVLFITEAMQAIPGNKHFQGTVEFATLMNFYFSNTAHYIGELCLYCSVQSNSVQSLVLLAQTVDSIIIDIFKKNCALAISKPHVGWYCVGSQSDSFSSPFGNTWILFSCGLLCLMIIVIPFAFINLDDSISAQIISFAVAMLIGLQWMIGSFVNGLDSSRVPTFGTGFSTVIGTIMLNLAFTTFVPSWVNLKKREVNTQGVVWTSGGTSLGYYILVGLISAYGFNIDSSGSILPSLMRQGGISKATAYLFSLVMLLPAIPVNFYIAHSNLVQNRVASPRISLFLSYILPWLVSIPLQTGDYLSYFLNWSSLIFVSTANFILPLFIYLKCLRFRRKYNQSRELSEKQLELLKAIHWSSRTINTFIDKGRIRRFQRRRAAYNKIDENELTGNNNPNIEKDNEYVISIKNEYPVSLDKKNNLDLDIPIVSSTNDQTIYPYSRVTTPVNLNIVRPISGVQPATHGTNLEVTENAESSTLSKTDFLIPENASLNSTKLVDTGLRDIHISDANTSIFTSPNDIQDNSLSSTQGAKSVDSKSELSHPYTESGLSPKPIDIGSLSSSGAVGGGYLEPPSVNGPGMLGLVDSAEDIDDMSYLDEDVPDPDREHMLVRQGTLAVLEDGQEGPTTLNRFASLFGHIPRTSSAPDSPSKSSALDHKSEMARTASGMSGASAVDERGELTRRQTLPTHPLFTSPALRTLPTWFPVRGKVVALFLLFITLSVSVMDVVVTFVQL